MRAAVMSTEGYLTIDHVQLAPAAGEYVLVETLAATVCLTDAIARRRDYPIHNAPQIRGHGGVGIVREVGSDVTRVRPGDLVIAAVRLQCGECYFCERGQAEWCDRSDGPPMRTMEVDGHVYHDRADYPPRPIAFTADGTPMSAHARVGSYAEAMLMPEIVVTPLRTDVPADQLAMLTCGVGTGLGSVFNQAEVTPGDSVAIIGAGVIGLSMLAAVRLKGAGLVVMVDPDPVRRQLALDHGADVALAPGEGVLEQIWALSKARGVDIGFEAAGAPEAVELAFHATRRGAQVVLTGFGNPAAGVSFGMNELAIRGRRVMGTQYGAIQVRSDLPRYAALIEAGRIDVERMITHRFSLDTISEAIDAVEQHTALGAVLTQF